MEIFMSPQVVEKTTTTYEKVHLLTVNQPYI